MQAAGTRVAVCIGQLVPLYTETPSALSLGTIYCHANPHWKRASLSKVWPMPPGRLALSWRGGKAPVLDQLRPQVAVTKPRSIFRLQTSCVRVAVRTGELGQRPACYVACRACQIACADEMISATPLQHLQPCRTLPPGRRRRRRRWPSQPAHHHPLLCLQTRGCWNTPVAQQR